MKRKGISPLIAAVLMIAFTMAIASLFSGWIQQTQSDTQENVDQQRQQTINCNNQGIEIMSGDESEAVVRQVRGEDPIGNVTVVWRFSGSDPVNKYHNFTDPRNAARLTSGTRGTLEEIEASSNTCDSVTDSYEN